MRLFKTLVATSALLNAACFAAAEDTQPKKATGRVIDVQGKPIPGVSVGFRAVNLPKNESAFPDDSTLLGYGETDVMGGFSVSLNPEVDARGPIKFWASHRDFVYHQQHVKDVRGLEVTLKLLPRVALVRRIIDERDTKRAAELTVKLLEYKPERTIIPDEGVEQVFPYLNDLRDPLLEIVNSGQWDAPIKGREESLSDRARELLAYGSDPRDKKILEAWWIKREKARGEGEFGRALLPEEAVGETPEEAIQKLRKLLEIHERAGHHIAEEARDRVLVSFFYSPIRSWHYHFDAVVVRRDGKWRVLFFHQTDAMHLNFGARPPF